MARIGDTEYLFVSGDYPVGTVSLVYRARELAKSGEFATQKALRNRLKAEGYSLVEIAGHFHGRGFRRELKELIKKASNGEMRQCRILVVEDDFIVAADLASKVEEVGGIVIGPVPTVKRALELIGKADGIDGALLDIRLGETDSFDVADALDDKNVPYVFVSGFDKSIVPARFSEIGFFQKPFRAEVLLDVVERRFCGSANT